MSEGRQYIMVGKPRFYGHSQAEAGKCTMRKNLPNRYFNVVGTQRSLHY